MSFDAGGPVPPEEEFANPGGGVVRRVRTGGDGGDDPDLDGTLEDAALKAVTGVLRNGLVPFGLAPGSPEDEAGGGEPHGDILEGVDDKHYQQQQQGDTRDGYASDDPGDGGHSRKRGGRGSGQQGSGQLQQGHLQAADDDDEQLQWFGAPGSVDVVGDLLSGFLASGTSLVNDAARALTSRGLAVFPVPGDEDADASFRRRRGRQAQRDGQQGDGGDGARGAQDEVPVELLDLAVEEGFQRQEAHACCLRVAAAYGICPGDLSVDFGGDLVLQALTEERAHPGVLFVKPAAAVPLAQQHALRRRNRPRDGSGTDTASGGGWTSDASAFLSFRAPQVAAVRARKRKQLLTCIDALQILVLGSLVVALVLLYVRGGPSVAVVGLSRAAAVRLSAVHFWSTAPTLSPTFLAAASGDVARLRAILNAARDAAASASAHKSKRREASADDLSSAHHVQNAAMAAVAQDGAARGGRRARLGGSATPVAAAVSGGHGGALAALLAAGASVHEGVTLGPPFAPGLHISPLAIAAVRGHVACAAALLHAGADTDDGITAYVLGLRIPLLRLSPLGLALSAGHAPVARALLRAGSHAHVCGSLLAGNVQVPCLTAAADAKTASSQKQADGKAGGKAAAGKAGKTGAMAMGTAESTLEVLHSWHAASATASANVAGGSRTGRSSAAQSAASSAAAAAAAAQQRAAAARHGAHSGLGAKQDSVVFQAARRAADAAHDAAVRAAAEAELAELESSRLAGVAADAAMVAAVARGVDGGEL